MNNNKLMDFYKLFFKSRELECDKTWIRKFLNQNMTKEDTVYDMAIVDQYMNDPQFVEKAIMKNILDTEKLDMNIEYLSLYLKQMNAFAVKKSEDRVIIMDELLTYTTLSFFLTVFSYAYDSSYENERRCVKNLYSVLEMQGNRHKIKVHNTADILKMITLPSNVLNLATDVCWNVWTFIIGHELFHMLSDGKMSEIHEENEADAFGYRILLHMIEIQRRGEMPEETKVYFENMYLTPVMLFQYFSMLDEYSELLGKPIDYRNHPSPEERQDHIFKMFETDVPDDFDTVEGNEILNIFLESLEILKAKTYQNMLDNNWKGYNEK